MTLEPVDISTPNWQCPYCHLEFRSDLDSAKECAALGPAEGSDPVLVLDFKTHALAWTEPGKTKLKDISEDGSPSTYAHVVATTLNGKEIDVSRLHQCPGSDLLTTATPDEVVGEWVTRDGAARRTSETNITELFEGKGLLWSNYGSVGRIDRKPWLRNPTELEREVLEMLNPPDFETLSTNTAEDWLKKWCFNWDGTIKNVHRGQGRQPYNRFDATPSIEVLAAIARTHGFGNDTAAIIQWANLNYDAIIEWHTEQTAQWLTGTEPCVFDRAAHASIKEPDYGGVLPKNPGKKRSAFLSEYLGWEPRDSADSGIYQAAMRKLTEDLKTEASPAAVPGLSDYTTFMTTGKPTARKATTK